MTGRIIIERALLERVLDAIESFKLPESSVVAAKAGELILRVPLETIQKQAAVLEPLREALQAKPVCNHCNGSGRMVRDPDIVTDQECFVCEGSGVEPPFMQAKPVEPDGPVKVHMRCQDCGHEQTVRGNRLNGATYFGSGYDFCDKCDGPPRLIPDIERVTV